MASLRNLCLKRDRHRCVVSRRFDWDEARNRFDQDGDDAKDDDGNPLEDDVHQLEVAHILPYALTSRRPGEQELVRLSL